MQQQHGHGKYSKLHFEKWFKTYKRDLKRMYRILLQDICRDDPDEYFMNKISLKSFVKFVYDNSDGHIVGF